MDNIFSAEMKRINGEIARAYGAPIMFKAHEPAAVATISVTDQPTMTGAQFMAKADAAYSAGLISAVQLSECEIAVNAGKQPRATIARAVLTGQPHSDW